MIRYSFLIPFWNLEPWMLQRMLDSIPHRDDVEIIVLDNASDDIDRSHLPGLDDARVRIIFQPERTTVGHCRNRLIGEAQGEWVIFADADDRFFTSELERLMDREEKETYDLIYWGMQTVYPNGTTVNECLGFQGTGLQPLSDRGYVMSHKYETPHKMARRSLLMRYPEIRFDEIPIYEDVAYSVHLLLCAERVGVYPPMVYQYLRRDTSTLGRSSWTIEELEEVFRHQLSVLDVLRQHHYPVHHQESTKGCLIRIRHISKGRFFRALYREWKDYGWALAYRDFLGAGFETYDTHLSRALFNHLRVKAGGLVRTLRGMFK